MPRYVIRGGRAGYERLKVLADARCRDTLAFLDRVDVPVGGHCVDLGRGGLDMDEVKLELAAADAEQRGLENVCDPPNEGFDFYTPTYMEALRRRRGGDPTVARKLARHLRSVGAVRPDMALVQSLYTSGDAKTLPLSTLDASAEAIVAEGVATEDEIDAALRSLAALTDEPESFVSEPRIFQVSARKAAG